MITFPDHVKSHTRKQISCFGSGWAAPASRLHGGHPGCGALASTTLQSIGMSKASSFQPSAGYMHVRGITSLFRSLCWSGSTWAKSLSSDTSSEDLGGSDGTRNRDLLSDRRSNQLNYAPQKRLPMTSTSHCVLLGPARPSE